MPPESYDSVLKHIIQTDTILLNYFTEHEYPKILNGQNYVVKGELECLGKQACVAVDASNPENFVLIKIPAVNSNLESGRQLLFEYMMQHDAHKRTYFGTCTVAKPLGIIRYNTGNPGPDKSPFAYLMVITFCPVVSETCHTVTLAKALQAQSTVKPLLTVIEWRNVCKYLIEGFNTLQRNDIYHNNVHPSNILLRFHENSVQPMITGFTNSSRATAINWSPSKPLPKALYTYIPTAHHIAPELFQQAFPLPTSDLYGVSLAIEAICVAIRFFRTASLMRQYRQKNPSQRDNHAVLLHKMQLEMTNDLQDPLESPGP